jgi:hypothetical protein
MRVTCLKKSAFGIRSRQKDSSVTSPVPRVVGCGAEAKAGARATSVTCRRMSVLPSPIILAALIETLRICRVGKESIAFYGSVSSFA